MNMVLNARDSIAGEGNIDIDVRLKTIEKESCSSCHDTVNGEYIAIEIADNGSGMDKQLITKIFDPFFTTKPTGKGTGMGLSVAHGVLHKAGGHLLCDSTLNVGTKFTLLLPNKEIIIERNSFKLSHKNSIQNLSIAIIDDEENILEILHDGLEKAGHSVAVYTNASEFCKYSPLEKGRNFDMIFTDLSMPECSGAKLVRSSRKNGYKCPIIAMSGYNKDINLSNYKNYCFDDYLSKPFTIEEVVEKINVNSLGGSQI